MKIFELKEDTMVTDWLDNIKKSNTIKLYLLAMQGYTEFLNKSPNKLINEAEEESKLLARKRNIKKYLIGFKKHMIDKGLSPMTQKAYMAGVKAFYAFYDIELPKIKIDNVKPLRENKGIPTKEDIQEALKVCDPLETAVLLVGATSGLSANEIINLRIDDFKKGYDPTTGITTLDLRRQKVELDFITFLTPEASNAVKDYLTYRARTIKTSESKRLMQLEKQRITSDTGYLFISRSICDDYLTDHDDEYRKIAIPAFMEMYRTVSEKATEIKDFADKIINSGEMAGVLNWAIEGLKRLEEQQDFTDSRTVEERGNEYDKVSNPLKYFVDDCIHEDSKAKTPTFLIYDAYNKCRKQYHMPELSDHAIKTGVKRYCGEVGVYVSEKRERSDKLLGFDVPAELKEKIGTYPHVLCGIKVKGDGDDEFHEENNETSLFEKMMAFLCANNHYMTFLAKSNDVASAFIKENPECGKAYGTNEIVDAFSMCRRGCRA